MNLNNVLIRFYLDVIYKTIVKNVKTYFGGLINDC